jgi:hypothetical protein
MHSFKFQTLEIIVKYFQPLDVFGLRFPILGRFSGRVVQSLEVFAWRFPGIRLHSITA